MVEATDPWHTPRQVYSAIHRLYGQPPGDDMLDGEIDEVIDVNLSSTKPRQPDNR